MIFMRKLKAQNKTSQTTVSQSLWPSGYLVSISDSRSRVLKLHGYPCRSAKST